MVDSFEYLTEDQATLGAQHLPDFVEEWSKYDMDATGKISHRDLIKVLKALDPPLGLGPHAPTTVVHSTLMRMDLPMDSEGRLEFRATLMALVRLRKEVLPTVPQPLLKRLVRAWFPVIPAEEIDQALPEPVKNCGHSDLCSCMWSLRFYYSILKLQHAFRRRRELRQNVANFQKRTAKQRRMSLTRGGAGGGRPSGPSGGGPTSAGQK